MANSKKTVEKIQTIKEAKKDIAKILNQKPLTIAQLYNKTYLPTGIRTIDIATMGGIPENAVTQIIGYKGSTKTTLTFNIMREAQQKYPDKKILFIDSENSFDPLWANKHGVDLGTDDSPRIDLYNGTTGEENVDIISALLKTEEYCLVVIDSIPTMKTRNIIDKASEDVVIAPVARVMDKLVPKTVEIISQLKRSNKKISFVFINQYRINVGTMFGDNRTAPGGKGLEHLIFLNIELNAKKKDYTRENKDVITLYNEVTFKIIKFKWQASNKIGKYHIVMTPDSESDSSADNSLPQGSIAQASLLLNILEEIGDVEGAGKRTSKKYGFTFKSKEEFAVIMYSDTDLMDLIVSNYIMRKRVKYGMTPYPSDNYLLRSRDDLKKITSNLAKEKG